MLFQSVETAKPQLPLELELGLGLRRHWRLDAHGEPAFCVRASDPLTFVTVTMLLTVVLRVASYIPARDA